VDNSQISKINARRTETKQIHKNYAFCLKPERIFRPWIGPLPRWRFPLWPGQWFLWWGARRPSPQAAGGRKGGPGQRHLAQGTPPRVRRFSVNFLQFLVRCLRWVRRRWNKWGGHEINEAHHRSTFK